MKVKAWEEKVIIPTYEAGKPEKNPIFLEKRVYQGSSGVVYPHPVIEKISDTPVDKEWLACYLENDFIKIMILPELGGRVQMAWDKMKQRHFVYYNEVIKPALVGLAGPWISGGIEFNWPQHHRPGTYDPVDYTVEENADGSMTVWCSEIERMHRTRGMAGFTLYPDKSYLEIKVKLFNRTHRPQKFLWWANPAVAVNDHYQSVFPPDVNAVFDHGKRDVSKFPIATGTYYKMDYGEGVDISKYKNIPVPTSYMAIKSSYDFVGGYENDSKGGLLHVANHHISPGKKQWTWGNGDFGIAWDRNLTDRNGPYIELMCGVYTDNQPDFTWLMPYEEKSFKQYFMPYRDLGVVKNASKDIMLNLEIKERRAFIGVYTTGIFPSLKVVLKEDKKIIFEEVVCLDPSISFIKDIALKSFVPSQLYTLCVYDNKGKILLEWSPEKEQLKPVPEPARPAKEPEEIVSQEELFLNGLHLEQYQHATCDPTAYYREALKRDPGDSRCNNAMGMWFLRRGKFSQAEQYLRKACERLVLRNPNPYDGEPLFNLGLALRYQDKDDEAFDYFHKSVWNAAQMDSGYFQLACLNILGQDWNMALENAERSLIRNGHNHKTRHLKVIILRKKKQVEEAFQLADESLGLDPFNFGVLYEKHLMGDEKALEEMKHLLRDNIQNYIETALDYSWAGLYDEGIGILDIGISSDRNIYPMALYFKAWMLFKKGETEQARETVLMAENCSSDYCFPGRVEAVTALELAGEVNPSGARAPYYLGNFWYSSGQYADALNCFEKAESLDKTVPVVYRNLALAKFNKLGNHTDALKDMEKAFNLNPADSRILMELNQLYKKTGKSTDFRFQILEKYDELVKERDDLYLEKAELHILKKEYREAWKMIMNRKFHPWEGGEGKVSHAYIESLTGMAREALDQGEAAIAEEYLNQARVYPENLGEGKLRGAQENQIFYWLGCSYDMLGKKEEAISCWEKGSTGLSEPAAAWYYNDQQPDTIYYQGLSWLKLGEEEEAMRRFNKLIDYGEKHYFDQIKIDYFAVSLPDLQIWEDDLNKRNKIHCCYLMALGYKGKGENTKAAEYFRQVTEMDPSHEGAVTNINI